MSDHWIFSGGFDLYAGLKQAAALVACCVLVIGAIAVYWRKFVGAPTRENEP